MNPTIQRYVISSITTFAAMFLVTLGTQLTVGTLDIQHIGGATIVSLLAVAFRAGVKAVVESLVPTNGDQKPPTV